jgi:hypothetical protein
MGMDNSGVVVLSLKKAEGNKRNVSNLINSFMVRLCEAAEARLKGTSFSLQKTVECELRVESVIVQVCFVFSAVLWIRDPDFYPSRISDPGSKNSNKREG